MTDARPSLLSAVPTTLDEQIVRALAWCRLGSGAGFGYPEGDAFARAKALGLLAQDSVWRATPQGEGVLIALGLLDSSWNPDRVHVSVLWAKGQDHGVTQFVAAFAEGLADAWPEAFDREVEKAKRDWREWPGEGESWEFWMTHEEIGRR